MMATRHFVSLSLGLAVVALSLAPAAGSATSVTAAALDQPMNHTFKIRNRASEPVTVRVLHNDGSLQKQETIKPGDNHNFTFSWCYTCCGHDKERKYEVKTGSTLRATGTLVMTTKAKDMLDCDQNSKFTVKDENTTDAWSFSTDHINWYPTDVLIVTNLPSS